MRLPNKAIERERHITPTIDDIITELNCAQLFSKIDLNNVKLVTIILYMYIVYISLIDKCELMTFILYTCIVSKVMIG